MELKDLKVGDKVIVHYNYSEDIKYVSRITKTQIIVDGVKYRYNGSQIGGDVWYRKRISIATEDKIFNIEREKKIKNIQSFIKGFINTDFFKYEISLEQLEQIYEVIKTYKP